MTADGNATASNCTSIELSPGEHVLSSQALFTAELGALEIRGTREEYVSVVCRYNVETNFTWYFSEISSLRIHNIQFHGCPRPLRIDTATDVELTNCSFRSAHEMSPLCLLLV